jgi:toxin ParE1/3/4
MATIVRSSLAEADLDDILRDFQRSNPPTAERYAAKFAEQAHALSQFPEMGRPRPEIGLGIRSTLVKPYIIFYRYHGDAVQILGILHGKRDLKRIMEDEPGG